MPILLDPTSLQGNQNADTLKISNKLQEIISICTIDNEYTLVNPGTYQLLGDHELYQLNYFLLERHSEKNSTELRYEVVAWNYAKHQNNQTPIYESVGTLRLDDNDNFIFRPTKQNQPNREVRLRTYATNVNIDSIVARAEEVYVAKKRMSYLHPKSPLIYTSINKKNESQNVLARIERPVLGDTVIDLLIKYKKVNKKLRMIDKLTYIKLMINALKKVHDQGVMHGDVKPDKFIIGHSFVLVGLDFASLTENLSYISTPEYAAPECFQNGIITKKSDVFSLAKSMGVLLTQTMPINNEENNKVIFNQLRSDKSLTKENKKNIRSLLKRMTDADPNKRPTIDEVAIAFENILRNYQLDILTGYFEQFLHALQGEDIMMNLPIDADNILPFILVKRESNKHPNEIRWEVIASNAIVIHNQSQIYPSLGALRLENGKWVFKPRLHHERQCKIQKTPLSENEIEQRVVAEITVGQTHLKTPVVLRDGKVFTISRYLPGNDLIDIINQMFALNKNEYIEKTFSLIFQIIDALKIVHDSGIIHKDIKPDNIIHDSNQQTCTIIDYEFSSKIGVPGKKECGTIGYRSPESFEKTELTQASDIFSLAFTILAILRVHPPQLAKNNPYQCSINPLFYELYTSLKDIFSVEVIQCIQLTLQRMTVKNPTDRCTLEDVRLAFTEIQKRYQQSETVSDKENRKPQVNTNVFFISPNKNKNNIEHTIKKRPSV